MSNKILFFYCFENGLVLKETLNDSPNHPIEIKGCKSINGIFPNREGLPGYVSEPDGTPWRYYWGYCCDCNVFWQENYDDERKECPNRRQCTAQFSARYLCNKCRVMSLQSNSSQKREYHISPQDYPEPACPGCGSHPTDTVVRHSCSRLGVPFHTLRNQCPFDGEKIEQYVRIKRSEGKNSEENDSKPSPSFPKQSEKPLEPNEPPRKPSPPREYTIPFAILFGVVISICPFLFIVGLVGNINDNRDPDSNGRITNIYVMLLFCIPFVAQVIGLSALHRNRHKEDGRMVFSNYYLSTMSLCLFAYCGLWYIYSTHSNNSETWSWLALACIIVLFGSVIRMTWALIKGPPDEKNETNKKKKGIKWWTFWDLYLLRDGVSKEKTLALLFFFAVFLSISYLFAFAFAFHDKSHYEEKKRPALYMKNLDPLENNTAQTQSGPTESQPNSNEYTFEFDQGTAILAYEDTEKIFYPPTIELDEIKRMHDNNHKSMNDCIEKIRELMQGSRRVRISIIGKADENPPQTLLYKSNYELAEARAKNVERIMMEILLSTEKTIWSNIEWFTFSLSSENPLGFRETVLAGTREKAEKQSEDEDNSPKRVVDVLIAPIADDPGLIQMKQYREQLSRKDFKSLNLLDYIYFSNYTITTTGYGDIIPTTPYAKFLCSLANIYEVFFLVVFFNALLSLRSDKASSGQLNNEQPPPVDPASIEQPDDQQKSKNS